MQETKVLLKTFKKELKQKENYQVLNKYQLHLLSFILLRLSLPNKYNQITT